MKSVRLVVFLLAIFIPKTTLAGDDEVCSSLSRYESRANDQVADYVAFLVGKYSLELNTNDHLYRGIADPNYGVRELISFIKGDPKYEPRSWVYSRTWQNYVTQGMSEHDATLATDLDVLQKIQDEIRGIENSSANTATVIEKYFNQQRRSTLTGLPEEKKQGAIVAFHHGSKIPFSINYLLADLKKHEEGKRREIGILFVVREARPRGIGFDEEYHVLSHLPVRDLQGAYIAFPTKRVEDRTFNDRDTIWYYIEIVERNPDGSAKMLSVSQAEFRSKMEIPQVTNELFQHIVGDQSGSMQLENIARQHPQLRAFISSLLAEN